MLNRNFPKKRHWIDTNNPRYNERSIGYSSKLLSRSKFYARKRRNKIRCNDTSASRKIKYSNTEKWRRNRQASPRRGKNSKKLTNKNVGKTKTWWPNKSYTSCRTRHRQPLISWLISLIKGMVRKWVRSKSVGMNGTLIFRLRKRVNGSHRFQKINVWIRFRSLSR